MKFRKKPVIIEGIQWTGSNFLTINEWANQERINVERDILRDTLSIATMEGRMFGHGRRLHHPRRQGRVLPVQAGHLRRHLRGGRRPRDQGDDVSAILSPCGRYRYTLTREVEPELTAPWPLRGHSAGAVLFVMLNPSTADAEQDDPTIRRCKGFASSWGFRRLLVGNLFAWRATDPAEIKACPAPVGPANMMHLAELMDEASLVVAAWGAATKVPRKLIEPRVVAVRDLAEKRGKPLHALHVAKGGSPTHPLYLPASLTPVPWTTEPQC